MKHARKDYNRRIQDSEGIIPKDEPVFLLRGQDIHAPIILTIYAALVQNSEHPDKSIVKNTLAHAKAMRAWQEVPQNKYKYPDMSKQDSVY